MIKSAYIHIPFCKKICSYCDFCKVFYHDAYVDKYLLMLEKEIVSRYQGEVLETIYIGGGTPSVLSEEELEYLFQIVSKLHKTDTCEYTIEANFDSITFSKLELCKKYGVNRISFGLETTNSKLLEKMNRDLDLFYVEKVISYCKNIGLTNINVDLLYAFSGEKVEDVSKDIDYILSLDIPHISTYSLILEPHTKLYLEKEKEVDEELDYLMWQTILSKLDMYEHYEISNFSKEGFRSKHNQVYWNNLEYYGFGVGASGYIQDRRYTNTRSIQNYLLGKFELDYEKLSLYDRIYYEVILNLRMKQGISKSQFYEKYNSSLLEYFDYTSLVEEGLLEESSEFIFIPEEYWYISNEILVRLIEECKYE